MFWARSACAWVSHELAGRLDTAVGAEVPAVVWRGDVSLLLLLLLAAGQPLEFALARRALPAQEALGVQRQGDLEGHLVIAHSSDRTREV